MKMTQEEYDKFQARIDKVGEDIARVRREMAADRAWLRSRV